MNNEKYDLRKLFHVTKYLASIKILFNLSKKTKKLTNDGFFSWQLNPSISIFKIIYFFPFPISRSKSFCAWLKRNFISLMTVASVQFLKWTFTARQIMSITFVSFLNSFFPSPLDDPLQQYLVFNLFVKSLLKMLITTSGTDLPPKDANLFTCKSK